MIAPMPPMGWNTWNTFGWKDVSDEVVCSSADVFVKEGLREAGYEYVVIDDCWHLKERAKDGRMQPDPTRFRGGSSRWPTMFTRWG